MGIEKEFVMKNEEDHLKNMFASTKDGKLTVPRNYEDLRWHQPSEDPDGADYYDHFSIQWDEQDLKAVLDEYRVLRADLETLAEKAKIFDEEKDFEDDARDVREFLQDERLFGVWNTYVRAWEDYPTPEEFHAYLSEDSVIDSYLDKIAMEKAMADGYQLTEDRDIYDLVKDTVVTEDELDGYYRFRDRILACRTADAMRRVGDGPEALRLVDRAKRTWKLLVLGAPSIIMQIEYRELAQALALHRFAAEVDADQI